MEETKETKGKEVKMKAQEPRKLSYEELENIAHQMSEQGRQLATQNQQLRQALQETELSNFYRRLDYLWQVITSETPYITEEFKQGCGEEFMNMMTPPQEEPEEEQKGE